MKAARSCARSSIGCILPDVYDVSWWVRDRRGARSPGGWPRARPGSVLLVEAGTRRSADGRRRLAGRHRAGPLPQLGAPGRAGPGHRRGGAARPGRRRVGRDQRRGLDVRDARRRRGLGPARLALPDPAVLVRDRRTGGPVRGDGPSRCCAVGGAAAPERRAVPRRRGDRWASRPSRTRTRAARPAPGWCRATAATACGSTPPAPTCPAHSRRVRSGSWSRAGPPCAPTRPSSGCWWSTAARWGSSSRAGSASRRARWCCPRAPSARRGSSAAVGDRAGRRAAGRGHRRPARPTRSAAAGPTTRPCSCRSAPTTRRRTRTPPPARPRCTGTRAPTRRATSRCCCSPVRSSPAATCTSCARSSSPTAAACSTSTALSYGYLRTEHDRRRLRHALRTGADLLRAGLGARTDPGGDVLGNDRALDAWIAAHLTTAVHLCGSAAMGRVVDPDCGCSASTDLRVADTSVLPSCPAAARPPPPSRSGRRPPPSSMSPADRAITGRGMAAQPLPRAQPPAVRLPRLHRHPRGALPPRVRRGHGPPARRGRRDHRRPAPPTFENTLVAAGALRATPAPRLRRVLRPGRLVQHRGHPGGRGRGGAAARRARRRDPARPGAVRPHRGAVAGRTSSS